MTAKLSGAKSPYFDVCSCYFSEIVFRKKQRERPKPFHGAVGVSENENNSQARNETTASTSPWAQPEGSNPSIRQLFCSPVVLFENRHGRPACLLGSFPLLLEPWN